jgi:aldose 1-epimerase
MDGVETFGTAPDGSPVGRVTLEGGGLKLNLISWGAVVQDLRLAGHEPPLVLGFPQFGPYVGNVPFLGATAGRYANRINHGRFRLDGDEYQLDRNFLGKHNLHGGAKGLAHRNWRFTEIAADRAVLEIEDPAGAMGFPGTCRFNAVFSVPGDGVLAIEYHGVTDAPTLVNLAHHSYFNLDGGDTVLGHEFAIDAEAWTSLDDELIPTGEVLLVAGTERDFRKWRVLGPDGPPPVIHDQNYCISSGRGPLKPCARVRSPRSGVMMEVATTEPGLQFYAGHKLDTEPGLTGTPYKAFAGFCMEPQVWPDSPNHAYFTQAVLRPGEKYLQKTQYRFAKG